MEWGHEANGLSQAGIPSVTNEASSWRWVQLVHIEGAVTEHPDIIHTAREAYVDIQKAILVVSDGLKLDGVQQFPVKVVHCKPPRWYNAPIYAHYCIAEIWGTRQLLEPSPNFLQLIPVYEAD